MVIDFSCEESNVLFIMMNFEHYIPNLKSRIFKEVTFWVRIAVRIAKADSAGVLDAFNKNTIQTCC